TWLANSPEVPEVVHRLTAFTRKITPESEIDWARHQLVSQIDEAVADPASTQRALSECLAAAGILPMFGFPTTARTLYETKLGSVSSTEITTRPLGQAVSLLAPGAQIVKDGWVHTVDGFALPQRRHTGGTNPLGRSVIVNRCPT